MKLKLKTLELQEMVSKAIKGASQNKVIPLTSLMGIKLEQGTLTLSTTDGSNMLQIVKAKVEGEDFKVTVQADIFSKLVTKTTSNSIILELEKENLSFKGNGKYSISLPLDEEGELIDYPEIPYGEFEKVKAKKTQLSTVKAIINANKAALAETMEKPYLTGYYFDSGVTTTDTYKVCNTDIEVLGQNTLLPAELVNLFSIIDKEDIAVKINGDEILLETDNVAHYQERVY